MKSKIRIIAFILILGTSLTAALLSVDWLTSPVIARNEELKLRTSILQALAIDFAEGNLDQVFTENIKPVPLLQGNAYKARDGRLAFEISGSGVWGPIYGVIAFKPDLKTIDGIKIIRQEETPGLGGRIAEREFLSRFTGKTFNPLLLITSAGKAAKVNEIDGIAGATLSCKAFEKLLNSESKRLLSNYQNGNGK